MTVTVTHHEMLFVLDVYHEDGINYFGINRVESQGASLPVTELAEVLLSEGLEIERKAKAQLERDNLEAA